MTDQLESIITRYNDLRTQMMDESVYSDLQKMKELNKELSDLEDAYQIALGLKQALAEKQEANTLLQTESDPDLLEMAKEQLLTANERIATLEEQLKIALLPRDPNDDKNIFLEIRPAAGGDEA